MPSFFWTLGGALPDHGLQAWALASPFFGTTSALGPIGPVKTYVFELVDTPYDGSLVPVGHSGALTRHADGAITSIALGVGTGTWPDTHWGGFGGGPLGVPAFGYAFHGASAHFPDGTAVDSVVPAGNGVVVAMVYCPAVAGIGGTWEAVGFNAAPAPPNFFHLIFPSLIPDATCPGSPPPPPPPLGPTGIASNPFSYSDKPGLGHYHVTGSAGPSGIYARAKFDSPPGGWDETSVTVATGVKISDLRVIRDNRQTLVAAYCSSNVDLSNPNVYLKTSNDDGKTWEAAVLAITGGRHPTVAVGQDGAFQTIVIAAYTGPVGGPGTITAQVKHAGDIDFGDAYVLKDDTDTNIAVADDTFHIQQAADGQARWLLHCVKSGGTETAHFQSHDDCKTFKVIP